MESELSRAEAAVISPDVVGPLPRKIHITGNGITLAIVTAVLFAIAVIYACFITTEAERQVQIRTGLRSTGDETMGKIEALRNPFHGLKEYVDYTFIADGKTYTGEAIVPLEDYHSVRLTSSLSIRYLLENLSLNHPVDWEWSGYVRVGSIFRSNSRRWARLHFLYSAANSISAEAGCRRSSHDRSGNEMFCQWKRGKFHEFEI
jgi:hypothetical protein